MDDDFDNGVGLPDDEIGVSIDDIAEAGPGGIEGEVETVVVAGGTRSSGGARAKTARAPKAKAAAPAKKSSKPKAAKKKKAAAKKKKAKAAKKPARKAARKSGKKAAKRKK